MQAKISALPTTLATWKTKKSKVANLSNQIVQMVIV